MIWLCNTFSPQMLSHIHVGGGHVIRFERISAKETGEILSSGDVVSCFGHASSAWHLSRYLHVSVPVSRGEICLRPEDTLIVAMVTNKKRWLSGVEGLPYWVFYRIQVSETHGGAAVFEEPSNLPDGSKN